MLQIDNTVLSLDVFEQHFKCDVNQCKGHCCVYGDSGAPLEKEEAEMIHKLYPKIKPYLQRNGIKSIEKAGTSMIDKDGDLVTPLITDKECAYSVSEEGIYYCGIERAYFNNKIGFRKPISCHLFPIRTKDYSDFIGVNYEKWDICKAGRKCGKNEEIPVHVFAKDALIRKFGKKWYARVQIAAREIFSKET